MVSRTETYLAALSDASKDNKLVVARVRNSVVEMAALMAAMMAVQTVEKLDQKWEKR